jgi:uncharacterized damage-inducible protein DinB
MEMTNLLLTELEHEGEGIRKTIEQLPEGKNDWRPHERSMPLGQLATLVANMPAWIDMVINKDEVDIKPGDGSSAKPPDWRTKKDLLDQFEASMKIGREALRKTTDDRLFNTRWRLKDGDRLLMDQTRYEGVREAILNHLAHHRGQLTVYLRMCGQKVPAIYGPSADEGK